MCYNKKLYRMQKESLYSVQTSYLSLFYRPYIPDNVLLGNCVAITSVH